MRKYSKQSTTEYKNLKRFCNQLTFIAIVLTVLTVVSYKIIKDIRTTEHEYTSMVIGTITKPTSYKITIQYKNRPIDFKIISPSGTEYTVYSKSNDNTKYEFTDDGTALTMCFDTSDYGEWTLNYNHRYHNNNLKINVNELPYNGLIANDIKAVIKGNTLTFEFTPYMGTGNEHIEINYYILGYTDGINNGSCGIVDGGKHIVETNTKVSDVYTINHSFMESESPSIRLITYQNECNSSDKYYSNIIIYDIEVIDTDTTEIGEEDVNETEKIQDTSN